MDWKDVPDSWGVRCSGNGNDRYTDENGVRRYSKDDVPVEDEYRPCGVCGKYPILDGEDYCLHHLGKVVNACCGHGGEGYIQFDNGVTVRGRFKIEYDKDKINEPTLNFSDSTFKITDDRRKLTLWNKYIAYVQLWAFNNYEFIHRGNSPITYEEWLYKYNDEEDIHD